MTGVPLCGERSGGDFRRLPISRHRVLQAPSGARIKRDTTSIKRTRGSLVLRDCAAIPLNYIRTPGSIHRYPRVLLQPYRAQCPFYGIRLDIEKVNLVVWRGPLKIVEVGDRHFLSAMVMVVPDSRTAIPEQILLRLQGVISGSAEDGGLPINDRGERYLLSTEGALFRLRSIHCELPALPSSMGLTGIAPT